MGFPYVLKCKCGSYPTFLVTVSATFDAFTNEIVKNDDDTSEYVVKCPVCSYASLWVDESCGGLHTAIELWNEAVSSLSDEEYRAFIAPIED